MTRDEFLAAVASDIDPAKYAGEAWYDTSEYAKPSDIASPHTRAEIPMSGEDYYPTPPRRRK